jgi:hypothetical protein
MYQPSSAGQFTREELSNAVKEYFTRNPEMYQRLLSMDERELDTNNPLGRTLAEFRYNTQPRFMSVDTLTPGVTTDDRQSLNRFTYVLNTPLKHTDPGVIQGDAWDQLTPEEQTIISDKLSKELTTGRRGEKRLETDREAFNRAIGTGNHDEVKNKVILAKNFIDTAGGHTNNAIWQEITIFRGVWLGDDTDKNRNNQKFHEGGGITFEVYDRSSFLGVLEKNNYKVNTWYDRHFNKATHPNDSAREITDTSYETGAHMANDDSNNLNRFFMHWDKRSTEFKKGDSKYWSTLTEQKDAGNSHFEPFTATEAREGLIKRGVVPSRER